MENNPTKYTIYLDQILDCPNKQDRYCIFSILECALLQIINDVPFVSEVIIQSDNADCYRNTFILLAISLLNIRFSQKMHIREFTHTETQDGRIILDSNFSRAMRLLK